MTIKDLIANVTSPANIPLMDQLTPPQQRDLEELAEIAQKDPAYIESKGWAKITRVLKKRWKRKTLAANTLRSNVERINAKY